MADVGNDHPGPLRIYLESGGSPVVYTIELPNPGATSVTRCFNVPELLRADGIDWHITRQQLLKWGRKTSGVEKVTMSYTGRTYAVAVLGRFGSVDHLRQANDTLRHELPEQFWSLGGQTYMLGPNEKDHLLLTAVDAETAFENDQHRSAA